MSNREPTYRPRVTTTGEAACWLAAWSNERLIPDGALPVRPWSRSTERELTAVAKALLATRKRWDQNGRRV